MKEGIDYPSQEQFDKWPDCKIVGCSYKCCLRLNSEYCWSHTGIDKNPDKNMAELTNLNKTTTKD